MLKSANVVLVGTGENRFRSGKCYGARVTLAPLSPQLRAGSAAASKLGELIAFMLSRDRTMMWRRFCRRSETGQERFISETLRCVSADVQLTEP